ncbi:MAG: hypothetical protein KDC38_10950 [Planctomycetes bacterium]|nr:hypothetical protein [Planctomycetota bacterium]
MQTRTGSRRLWVIAIVLACLTPLAAQVPEYEVTLIEFDGPGLPPFNVVPTAINEAGVVVGWAQFSLPTFRTRAWVWTATGGMQLLPLLPEDTAAYDINASGVIVGGDGFEFGPGWVFENGQFSSIGTLGSDPASVATGVNDGGQVCGTSVASTIAAASQAVRFDSSLGLASLTPSLAVESGAEAINNVGQIVGAAGNQAFRWSPGVGVEFLGPLPPGFDFSFAKDVNDSGQVTGNLSAVGTSNHRAFLYTDATGVMVLPTPGGDAFAWGMNNEGHVVGVSDVPNTSWIWTPQQGVRDLSTLIDPALGMPLLLATDINDMGMIIARGTDVLAPGGTYVPRVAVLTPTGAGSIAGPQGLVCTTGPDTVSLSWSVPEPYDTVHVVRDGETIAVLDPSETTFTDDAAPLGPHTYRVRGEYVGSTDVSDAAFCSIELDGLHPAPESLTCTSSGATVDLTWSAPVPYEVVSVLRNGIVVAELSAGETGYSDSGLTAGLYEYRVLGEIAGVGSAAAVCQVLVGDADSILVYAPPGVSGVDGVVDELTMAGLAFVEVSDLDVVDLSSFTAMFAVFGMYPLGGPLTYAEGETIAAFVLGGGALYIEGGDIWATSAVNPFHLIDGVYASYAGGSFDTIEIEGQDAGTALDLSPFGVVAYGGPDHSMDWLGPDSPLAHSLWKRTVNDVDVGMYYAPPGQGPIIECSFQLGGISDPGVRSAVFSAYLSALGIDIPTEPPFRRGDANGDAQVDVGDAIVLLAFLFQFGANLPCDDAADVNDDGGLTIADPVSLLASLFAGSAPPPPPYPDCGADRTVDTLTCLAGSCP